MRNEKYSMSFTTGGLFHRESVKLAELYLDCGNWNVVREKVLSGNLLQTRTVNTSRRFCSEIISRLKTLHDVELSLLVRSNDQDQGYILWIAICRRYRFIADFATQVLHEHYISLNMDLRYDDYDSFFNRKAEWHPEIDEIRPATKNKLRQLLFKIMREADILTDKNAIKQAILSPQLLEIISSGNRQDLLLFPTLETG